MAILKHVTDIPSLIQLCSADEVFKSQGSGTIRNFQTTSSNKQAKKDLAKKKVTNGGLPSVGAETRRPDCSGCGGNCKNREVDCKVFNMEWKGCGRTGHIKKVCRTSRPKGAKNASLENSEGETDTQLANFAFPTFSMEPQPTTDEDATSEEEASIELLDQAPLSMNDPEAANGASIAAANIQAPADSVEENTTKALHLIARAQSLLGEINSVLVEFEATHFSLFAKGATGTRDPGMGAVNPVEAPPGGGTWRPCP